MCKFINGADSAIDMFSDSTGAIALCTNPVGRARHKHVDLADHYARELFEAGIITISFVPTDEMIADTFTKALPEAKFKKFAKAIMGH
jgi:LDH2 family malate/lactate/ureidoglycolate dehydrogenase